MMWRPDDGKVLFMMARFLGTVALPFSAEAVALRGNTLIQCLSLVFRFQHGLLANRASF